MEQEYINAPAVLQGLRSKISQDATKSIRNVYSMDYLDTYSHYLLLASG